MKVTFKNPPVQVYAKHWLNPRKRLKRKNKPTVFWTDEEINYTIQSYNSGWTAKQIAKGLPNRTVAAVKMKISKMHQFETFFNLLKNS